MRFPRSRLGVAFGCSLALHALFLALIQSPKRPLPAVDVPMSVLLLALRPPALPARPPEERKPPAVRKLSAKQPAVPPALAAAPADPGEPRPAIRAAFATAFPVSPPRSRPAAGPVGKSGAAMGGRLTRFPYLEQRLSVGYPARALATREQAKVVFQLVIDEAGRVEEALPLSAVAEDFIAAAGAALRRARFVPGEMDGRPVRVRVYFAVDFGIE